MASIGRSIPRTDGREKVTGTARYIDDFTLPGMLYGATVRSHVPRGIIRGIRYTGPIPWDEFTIVTAADIPGRNCVALITDDQPYLAHTRVNHAAEPIVLLAHPDRQLVEEARRHVVVDIEPLTPVLTLQESLTGSRIIWGEDNIFRRYDVARGDVDAVWSTPGAVIVEGEYETGAQEQLYIEPNGMVATADRRGLVTVRGSMQCPYYVHRALAVLFGVPVDRVRVVQMETGGGFGGKEEYPSMIAGHAALLAWKSGRPVKLVYDRAEDMTATTKRHPSRTRHRTAVTRDGRLLAMDVDFVIDGGAYCTLSPVVLSRGTIHAAGPYFCPNVRVQARAVATNVPPHGAFRGFGAPQSIFALERHMDRVAAAIGLQPDDLRRRNFIARGQVSAVGQVIREPVDLPGLLDRALAVSGFREKRAKFELANAHTRLKKGIGVAAFMHGAGFTGSGEAHLSSVASVDATADGRFRVLAASTEIGQGTRTIFAQIAADALGVDYGRIDVVQPDTQVVPDSGPTVASRTCMIVGKLVEEAATDLRETLVNAGFLSRTSMRPDDLCRAAAEYLERYRVLRGTAQYVQPPGLRWDDEKYQGDAYSAYAWAVYVAEVTVDPSTCEIHLDDFVAVQEVGKVINPVLATGQIEGGVAQAIGWTLFERVVWRDGVMANGQMTNYIMPSSLDLPRIRVFFEEALYSDGPGGAKGIGELPMDGPAPAIVNAVAHATGTDPRAVPLLPETLLDLLQPAGGEPPVTAAMYRP